ncbi:tRNA (adenosine(37)-N6)-threonylcarbamoyltransferase complex ATPase subunit type 1 TsaE [Enhygromyxa salina]|uniref:tRNA threonylcarbamoyladenosine biosynthesis protein TsaE n=1 Tax=Enhygromyxa salina TaxID=215803 RepID=A0A2S9YM80_9BACT|nr:tRNA (adenosine(37)-N6)-threonylcarbamoyltransferase complex ATPase subunit type 1 TsaE [Enhygromyxa salina]PRQ06201.1 tRNA threonylcarbamoyladenosine biosynthesis protein TsaE [Enhygromyxa salina]
MPAPSPALDLERERELDEPQMLAWAESLGASLRGGDVLLLRGEMGAGKTTLVRALARGLGVTRPERVCSPTYTVCMIHPGPIELVHVDLFRLGEGGPVASAAFEALGLEHDELPGPERVLVVEWSELWADPPKQHLSIGLSRVPDRPAVRRLKLEDHRGQAQAAAPGQ